MIYINLLIIFLFIITIHEFGHYFAARLFKADVNVFSIGFGKSIYEFIDKNRTIWKICFIPLGGYVKIKGLDNIFQKNELKKPDKGTFQSLSYIKKIIILLAGSIFNVLSAWICLFFILFFFGIVTLSNEVGNVSKNSPADINDIRQGDRIISVDDIITEEFNDIIKALDSKKNIELKILRKNIILEKNFDLEFNNELDRYIIGITSTNNPIINKYLFFKSLSESFYFIPNYYIETFNYLKKSLINNTLSKEISGPIGMVKMADQLMLDKIKGILFLFIMISLFVGMFNLLPIPLLDGGHIVYFSLRSLFSNSLPYMITKIYLLIGVSIISFLFIFITLNDIFYK